MGGRMAGLGVGFETTREDVGFGGFGVLRWMTKRTVGLPL